MTETKVDLSNVVGFMAGLKSVPHQLIQKHKAVPVEVTEETITLAVSEENENFNRKFCADEFKLVTGKTVLFVNAPKEQIEQITSTPVIV